MDNTNQLKPVHKTNWMVIILLIIICVIVAVGIWWWMDNQKKIAELERQISQNQVSAVPTPTPVATTTPSVTPSPTPTATAADPYAGWNTYVNDYYGYEIKYPKNWKVTNPKTPVMDTKNNQFMDPPHSGIAVVFEGPGSFDFHLVTKKSSESFSIGPTGIGWTDIEAGPKLPFSGIEIQKFYELFYDQGQQHSSFHYNKPGHGNGPLFVVGDREYILTCVHKNGTQYLNAKMDSETEAVVDKMVESFRLR